MDLSSQELGRLVFGRAFDGTSALLVARRANGRIAAANAALGELAGRAPEALIGVPAYELFGEAVDVCDPPPSPAAIVLGEVAVAVSAAAIDHPRAGALAACRVRVLDDDERRLAELARLVGELEATCGELDRDARAPVVRAGGGLAELAAQVAAAADAVALRATCAEIVGRLGQPMGALESSLRRAGDDVPARAWAVMERMERALVDVTRIGRRDPELTPAWVELGRELAIAAELAAARTDGAAAIEPVRAKDCFAYLPRGAFHHVLAVAVEAIGATSIGVAARDRAWRIAVRGPGTGGGAAPRVQRTAVLVDAWGGELAIAAHEIEISAPILIEP